MKTFMALMVLILGTVIAAAVKHCKPLKTVFEEPKLAVEHYFVVDITGNASMIASKLNLVDEILCYFPRSDAAHVLFVDSLAVTQCPLSRNNPTVGGCSMPEGARPLSARLSLCHQFQLAVEWKSIIGGDEDAVKHLYAFEFGEPPSQENCLSQFRQLQVYMTGFIMHTIDVGYGFNNHGSKFMTAESVAADPRIVTGNVVVLPSLDSTLPRLPKILHTFAYDILRQSSQFSAIYDALRANSSLVRLDDAFIKAAEPKIQQPFSKLIPAYIMYMIIAGLFSLLIILNIAVCILSYRQMYGYVINGIRGGVEYELPPQAIEPEDTSDTPLLIRINRESMEDYEQPQSV